MADIVYVVRHAAPPPENMGRYWGRGNPGVDAESLKAVPSLARLARERPERVVSSPLFRAAATAKALAGEWDLPVESDPDLAEADFGDFDGLTFPEISERYPGAARMWSEQLDGFSFPGGERVTAFLDRAGRAWRRWLGAPESSVLVVSHGGILSAWCCLFLGLPLSRRFDFKPDYAALTAFVRERDGSGWKMACFNNTLHFAGKADDHGEISGRS